MDLCSIQWRQSTIRLHHIKKWKKNAKDRRAYNSFERKKSDHRVRSAKIRLTLRANKAKLSYSSLYDWSSLKYNPHIANSFIL